MRDGQTWRLLTCHLVHWTPRMAAMDLGALLVLGLWLEIRRPALCLLTMAAGAASMGAAIHLLSPSVAVYRGASGIDSALFAAAAVEIIFASRSKEAARLAAAALAIFLAKVSWEAATGTAIAAGPLPSGVRVA
ncbi:MAG TPA: rhomboid family intramembrane serine protease, partial [Candidatus Saccharimonadales bacterium]|nr:rhomboid family intramembrane serine protease [Candidatus Saccharimonadales bacterium]